MQKKAQIYKNMFSRFAAKIQKCLKKDQFFAFDEKLAILQKKIFNQQFNAWKAVNSHLSLDQQDEKVFVTSLNCS